MSMFLLNLTLAMIWVAMTGDTSSTALLFGFLLGFAILGMLQPILPSSGYFRRTKQFILFLGYFLKEIAISSLRVAYDVITPKHISHPGVIGIPMDAETDFEITLLANLITLTPGTLSLDVSEDRKILYIHVMFLDDADTLRREIKNNLERRILELVR